MKYDTLNKKPKLYSAAILSLVATAVITILIATGAERHALASCFVMILYLASIVAILVVSFVRQLKYNMYSYNTIYYIGFAIYIFSILIAHIFLVANMIRYPDVYAADQIPSVILSSANEFMFFSFPVIFLFSAALFISNISLIVHEGRRFVNLLGIILSILLVGGAVFIFIFNYSVAGSVYEIIFHELINGVISMVYLYVECMLIGTVIANILAVRRKISPDVDFVIVLGCRVRRDGTPSPLLRGRLDRAIKAWREQKNANGKDMYFITSGGKGDDEPLSEAEAMKRYLIENGVPEELILTEERSTDTLENMKYSKEIINSIKAGGKVIFSTTNYHIFRSGILARRCKMRAAGIGSKTKWYFWPNASVREFVGLLSAHRLKQALIFGGMIAFYTAMTFIVYLR